MDFVGCEAFDCAGWLVHECAVDDDCFISVCEEVEDVHSAGSGVDEIDLREVPGGRLEQFDEFYTDGLVAHEGVAEAEHDGVLSHIA